MKKEPKLQFDEKYFEGEIREGFYVEPMMKRAWAAQLEVVDVYKRQGGKSMRITNNMMLNTTSSNINGNKLNVNNLNNQMSSQKKIQRPSENPVIAIRALRLRSTLSQINQYYEDVYKRQIHAF